MFDTQVLDTILLCMDDFTLQQMKTLNVIQEKILQAVQDSSQYTQDLLRQEMKAMEHRVDAKADKNKEKIIAFIDERILPQIESLDQRVIKFEAKIA